MRNVGDLADDVAEDFVQAYVDTLTGEEEIDQEGPMRQTQRRGLFSKIDFRWRPADKKALEAIRVSAEVMFADLFRDALDAVDEFYNVVRIQDTTSQGRPLVTRDQRPVWKKGPNGKPLEDWDQVTGQDIEAALFSLQRHKFTLSQQHARLLNEAILAKHSYDDIYNEGYESLMEGTQGERSARASRHSLADKYHAYYKWYLYSLADAFLKELNNFMRLLERLRYWRLNDGSQAPGVRSRN